MKKERNFTKVYISDRAYKRQKTTKHPWIFDNEIEKIEGKYINGELVDVLSSKKTYIGTGFINDNSKIRIRIISRNANDIFDDDFIKRRLKHAIDYRKNVMGEDYKCSRLIFSESDFLSGLVVDRYDTILVSQITSLGMERIKEKIYKFLYEILNEDEHIIDGIYERCDDDIRILEGLNKYSGFYKLENVDIPNYTNVIIKENNILYNVDFKEGQKTGFFLDQKYNRLAIQSISNNKKVLDCFTHTGSFGLNAIKGNAKSVTSLDISESAINMAKENAKLNNYEDRIKYEVCDAFSYLENMPNNEYDFIILDPPAFTKSKKKIHNAYDGYKRINFLAMKKLPKGGFLATCSCSHFMSNENFKKMLNDAAREANVELKLIEQRQQSKDHPILWNVPETNYLKFYIFQIC